jgi:hypothetical protein
LAAWIGVQALLFLGLLETGLRTFPALIPLPVLAGFHPQLRSQAATRRGLPTLRESQLLERDDGGGELRLFSPRSRISFPFTDTGAVGTAVMDDQGFCNPARDSYHRDRIDIVAVGDSFVWCTAVAADATWASRLGVLTGRSVYSLGRGGIGVYEYLQLLKHFGLPKRPGVVIMNVYEGNDLRDALRFHWERRKRGLASTQELGPSPILGNGALARKSYALNFLGSGGQRVVAVVRNRSLTAGTNFRYRIAFPDGPVAFNRDNDNIDEVLHARLLRDGRMGLDVFREGLAAFVEFARQVGFRPIITYSPSAYTAYAGRVEFEDAGLRDLLAWYSAEQRRFFAQEMASLGGEFLDLTPHLQRAAERSADPLYFPTNLHWTPAGHEVVARVVLDRLGEAPTAPPTGTSDGTIP